MKGRLYLTQHETEQILRATEGEKNGLRDRCMILMCFYHGLRISELTGLTVRDIDLAGGSIFIRRLKNGFSTVHPLQPDEQKLLGEWMRRRPLSEEGWLFPNAKGKHLTRQYMYKRLRYYGFLAGLAVSVHPHMLRHACGYELAEQGMDTRLIQDYLGHRNIRHTVHYTAGNAARFAQTWKKQRLAVATDEDECCVNRGFLVQYHLIRFNAHWLWNIHRTMRKSLLGTVAICIFIHIGIVFRGGESMVGFLIQNK